MALVESNLQTYTPSETGAAQLGVTVKVATDIGVVVYTNTSDGNLNARVLNISTGSLVIGALNLIQVDCNNYDTVSHTANELISAFKDAVDEKPYLIQASRSGDTVTEGSPTLIENITNPANVRIACPANNIGLAAYLRSDNVHRLCKFTIAGGTITALTPQTHGTDGDATPLAMIPINSSKVLYMYHRTSDTALRVQVIDIASAISEGTPVTVSGIIPTPSFNQSPKMLALLTSGTKAVAIVDDRTGAANSIELFTINISGNSISSTGSPFVWNATAKNPAISGISSTKVLAARQGSSLETINISGDTITAAGDGVTSDGTGVVDICPVVVDSGQAIFTQFDNVFATDFASLITGVPAAVPDQLRLIRLDADGTNLYVTGNQAGSLKEFTYPLSSLTLDSASDFGAATYAELDAYTRGLFPVVRPATDKVIYVYGRDGANKQTWYNDLSGTLGWQDIGPGTATWGTAKFAIAMMPDPLSPHDIIVAFRDDDIYQTNTPGTHSWTKTGDALGTLLPAAARHPVNGNEFLAAGTAAGSAFFTPNYGAGFRDIGGTTLGTINWFEVSR